MKIVLKKGTKECDFHNDLFALHQNYGGVEEKQEYWDSVVDALPVISKKYRGTDMEKLVDTTLIAFADYLNEKATNHIYSPKVLATIVCNNRTKEEVDAIIKEMRAEYE